VVTGGTDGIGAATARRLVAEGADVVVVGRSRAKADALRAAAVPGPGRLRAVVADLSEMATVRRVVGDLAGMVDRVDLLVQAVGILIARTEHTTEGIEKDFAVGYLARFVLLEEAAARGLLHPGTRLLTVAASSRSVPRYAQMEFSDLAEVERRVGMRSHGQAQLANDLLTAQAARRYGITAIGYGPGSVDTSIRREVPALLRAAIKPFFARTTRTPDAVAVQVVDILADPAIPPGATVFHDKRGPFPTAAFVADPARQADLLAVSLALGARTARPDGRAG
jgi:NAD(P)-dependent dehydrogenase (short-subunit alcohol dehydrogenase family)